MKELINQIKHKQEVIEEINDCLFIEDYITTQIFN
jgi:hypothetical protein